MLKRVGGSLLCLCLLLSALIIPADAANTAAGNNALGCNIVLAVDDTGSMKSNDPERIAGQAILSFLDKIPAYNDSKVDILTYSTEIMSHYGSFCNMDDAGEVAALRAYAETCLTQSGQMTDHALGLITAVNQLQSLGDDGRQDYIVLICDGENDYDSVRTAEISARDLAAAESAGIPVYIIGINLDEAGVSAYLNGIAATTGGEVLFISEADEVAGALDTFLGAIFGLEDGGVTEHSVGEEGFDYNFAVPENVFEQVITITHKTDGIEMSLLDGNNAEIPMDGSAYVTVTENGIYTNVHLLEPEAGTYQLHIENANVSQQDITISQTTNSEISVAVSVEPQGPAAGDAVTISAQMMRGTEAYTDLPFENLTAVASVTGPDGTTQELHLTSAGDGFVSAPLTLNDTGAYSCVVTISGKSFTRSSETLNWTVAEGAAVQEDEEQPEEGGFPIWIFLVLGGVLVLVIVAVLVLRGRNKPVYEKIYNILRVTYVDAGGSKTYSKEITPAYAYKPKEKLNLHKLLQDADNLTPPPESAKEFWLYATGRGDSYTVTVEHDYTDQDGQQHHEVRSISAEPVAAAVSPTSGFDDEDSFDPFRTAPSGGSSFQFGDGTQKNVVSFRVDDGCTLRIEKY